MRRGRGPGSYPRAGTAHRSDPTPHPSLVAQVLVAELALQVALLAFYDATVNQVQDDREQQRSREHVRPGAYTEVDQGHPHVERVTRKRVRPRLDDGSRGMVRAEDRKSA